MTYRIDIRNHLNIPLRVLLIPPKEPSPNFPDTKEEKETLLEYYDMRYPHTPDGQFISRYYLKTLLKYPVGLNLMGGIPNWSVDANSQSIVIAWANSLQ